MIIGFEVAYSSAEKDDVDFGGTHFGFTIGGRF